jgi:cytochrome c biogenesis factor
MKWVLNILAVLLLLMGTVWILQGTGVYAVGFMANQSKWTYIGIVVDLLAVGLFILANRRNKKQPPSA